MDHNEVDRFPSEESALELFQRWKEKHTKIYNHIEEEMNRFQNFKRNLKYILDKNAKRRSPNSHRLGLNSFADMSNEEFKQVYLSKVKKPINKNNILGSSSSLLRRTQSCDAPSSLDWRNKGVVTPIKNQGGCGKLSSKLCQPSPNIIYVLILIIISFFFLDFGYTKYLTL